MRKQNEVGSTQSIVIALLAVCLVGAIGYMVWQKNQMITPSDTTTGTSTTKQVDTPAQVKDPYYVGSRVASSNNAFSIVVPNGWKLTNDTTSDWLSSGPSLDGLVYTPSSSPSISEVQGGGWDGYTQHFYVQKTTDRITPTGTATDFTLASGIVGKKYTDKTAEGTTSEIYGTLNDDYYAYAYVFDKDSTQILVAFNIYDATSFDRTLVDEVVGTLEIN